MPPFALDATTFNKSGRIAWVDYAKGFCIVFVVMMHATLGVEKYAAERGITAIGDTGFMNYVVTFAQPFRMPDFFLISGLFLGLVIARPWLRYLDRKVVHFAYFYVLWLVIQFTFKGVGWIAEGVPVTDIGEKFVLALVQPYGTLWFIYMLPVMFLVTRLLSRIPWFVILAIAAILEIAPVKTGNLLIDEFAARYVYFFAGYALASPIFTLAAWARDNMNKALGYLAAWVLVNGIFTFTAIPAFLATTIAERGWDVPVNLAHLPFVSLALGAAGAVAVVCLSAVLSRFRMASFLRYLGENSIAVYLAFFLPMIVVREILLRFAPWMDLGTMSLIVLAASVIGPVIALEFTRFTGWFRFLFVRPRWAWLEKQPPNKSADAGLQPAE